MSGDACTGAPAPARLLGYLGRTVTEIDPKQLPTCERL
jgi:hypothetical protein